MGWRGLEGWLAALVDAKLNGQSVLPWPFQAERHSAILWDENIQILQCGAQFARHRL